MGNLCSVGTVSILQDEQRMDVGDWEDLDVKVLNATEMYT